MSQQWRQIQSLPSSFLSELKTFYAAIFPIEIRDGLSDWIEEQPWKQIDENDKSHEPNAIELLEKLLTQVYCKAQIIPALESVLQNLQNKYTSSPLLLVRDVKGCLDFEEQLIKKSKYGPVTDETEIGDLHCDVLKKTEEFKTLYILDAHILQNVKELKKKQEEFSVVFRELPLVTDHFKKLEQNLQAENFRTENLEPHYVQTIQELEKKRNELQSQREFINGHLVNCIKDIKGLSTKIIMTLGQVIDVAKIVQSGILKEDILEWKQKQQMSCNGGLLNPAELRNIQKRCDCLGNIVIKSVQHNLQFETILNHLPLKEQPQYIATIQDLRKKLSEMLMELMYKSFIVDHQPPQVLRKDSKFDATASLLVSKAINVETTLPKIKAYIVNEAQVRKIKKVKEITSKLTCGELLNNEAAAESLPCGALCAKFKHLVLKNYKRGSKKTGKKISEEKYCIVFECNVSIRIGALRMKTSLRTLSVPVIITTNVSQECQALSTIVWDHQFSRQGRELFEVPEQVPWNMMANLLDRKFKHETGKGLEQSHLDYLASKLFGQAEDYGDYQLTMDMFCKENMKESCFTFWDWFYNIMRLTKDHLTRPWKEGHIVGFVSKVEVETLLFEAQPGTFLCRFSDTKLGGISVAERKAIEVTHQTPFTAKDLQIRSLSNIINDQERWTHLYPDKAKEETFGRYANEDNRRSASTRYEEFMWIIRLKREDDEQVFGEQDCLQALTELIEGTDVSQFVTGVSDDDDMIID